MKNVASSETAVKLKEAGFPQPDIQIGQAWYNDFKEPSVIVQRDHEFKTQWAGCHLGTGATGNMFKASEIKENCCFAPTATDILRELPDKVLFWRVGDVFVCGVQMESEEGYDVIKFEAAYKHENPAEACALAWLKMNKK